MKNCESLTIGLDLKTSINAYLEAQPDKLTAIETIRDYLHSLSPVQGQAIDRVKWVPIERVEHNSYNPNSVAPAEMRLLYISIKSDSYTQPIVTIYDAERDKYTIVDGFHRYFVMGHYKDIYESTGGLLPCVVLKKNINERMASTIRHNRARGKHSVAGMSSMVFKMLEEGWEDPQICNELGLEPEELLRLKHITGFSKLFADHQYKKAWMTNNQARVAHDPKLQRMPKK